ncbi:hypothetical protein [Shewanella surugensis]|uniref:Uncharacterized protein n=1 Tax=Shewanella surugensis TaxID=212020 RepID=A0ABT0L9M1_9GAMM|nr:hypothetical protein [Shewanella surugensis]MCL1124388.1 hypothetical protein [Shewanella surugensis]
MDDATPKSNNLLGNHAAGERANALVEHLQAQGISAISLSYNKNPRSKLSRLWLNFATRSEVLRY